MDTAPTPELLTYYASPGPMTDPGNCADLFDDLPTDVGDLCQVVQNNLIHIFWAERYGRKLSEAEQSAVNLQQIDQKLSLIQQHDPRSLVARRSLEQRQVGNCRDFSLMLAAMLRYQGVPSRARCGFGTYFLPNHYEDHWVCEYWNADQERWVLVDAQLDDFQSEQLRIDFDPLDVPRDRFIVAGQAWGMCRRGQANSEQFGIFEMKGWWFIWGNVVRELLAFNKVELLPWDVVPGCMTHALEEPLVEGAELALYDGLAALTLAGDLAYPMLRSIYERDLRFRATRGILGQ